MFVIREWLYAHPVLSSTGQENNALTYLYRKWTTVQNGSRFHSCRLCESQLTKSDIVEMLLGVRLYKNKDKFIYKKVIILNYSMWCLPTGSSQLQA